MKCLLCQHDSKPFVLETFICPDCGIVFKNPEKLISAQEEKERYHFHQNKEDDQGYINFLNRLVEPLSTFLPASFSGLDFGCGPGPTISLLLEKKGGEMKNYDPLFFPSSSLLIEEGYDVVTSTEVVEHFKSPDSSWDILVGLVKLGGLLAVMTQFYRKEVDYASWWYKNDPTHVVFYQEKTFCYLEKKYNLERLFSDNKSVVIFRKR